MKFKSKSKESSSKKPSVGRTSKAADVHLEEDIHVWAGESFTSVASSVTCPPSQTASFYKKVLGGGKFDYDDDDDNASDGSSLSDNYGGTHSSDDNLSWADNRSRSSNGDDGGDSLQAVKKPSKKKKKGRRRRFFGGATIEEDQDGENEDAPQPGRRARRLSLFGSSESNHEVSRYSSTDGEFSVNQSEDGGHWSNDGSEDLGYGDAAPTVSRTNAKRRASLGGLFSKKQEARGGGKSDDGSHATRSQDGSNDELGYEDAAPTVSRTKAKRRGSLGGLFSKNQEVRRGGKSDDGSHAARSHDGSNDELGYEDAAPTVSREKTKRRGSLGGLFSKTQHEPDTVGHHGTQNRRRRNSLSGFNAPSEHTLTSRRKHDQDSVNGNSAMAASNHTTKTHKKSSQPSRRRQSLTGSSYKGNSVKVTTTPPKDIHWIVNQERKARGMPVFEKNGMLDALAKSMSNEMAVGLPPSPTEYYGNVGCGESLQRIHATIMEDRSGISRKNILSERFTEFGMALTQGKDGKYYMVALFNI